MCFAVRRLSLHSCRCNVLSRTACAHVKQNKIRGQLNAWRLWRHGVVVSGVRRMNEVNPRRARLVLDRLRAGIPSQYVTSQLDQLSLTSLQGR